MHEKVNGKHSNIIDNFVLCIRLLKKGYADYALDLFCMTMPMRVGHELAVSKWLPKGHNTDKLGCLTEAHVNALLEPMSGSSALKQVAEAALEAGTDDALEKAKVAKEAAKLAAKSNSGGKPSSASTRTCNGTIATQQHER